MSEENGSKDLEVIQTHALELIERAQIDMQIATARKYPRPELAVIKKKMISFATLDEETAESCFYTLRRADGTGDQKVIQGPSVRLAEIAIACYGNLRAASRVIDNDGKKITSQGVCHDLENNTCVSVEVQRRITNRQGRTYSEDMQITTGNAANSISFRNAAFKVIPSALLKPVYEAAKAVAVGTASTLGTKRDKVLKRLNSMGVDSARVLTALNKTAVESIDLTDLEILIGMGTAIKDGDTTVDEAFPLNRAEPVKGSVSLGQFRASADQNRGHDATIPIDKPAAAPVAGDDRLADPEPPKNTEEPAKETSKVSEISEGLPPAGLPNLEDWPDECVDEWYLVKGVYYRWNEAQGNYIARAVTQAKDAETSRRRPSPASASAQGSGEPERPKGNSKPRNPGAFDFDGGAK